MQRITLEVPFDANEHTKPEEWNWTLLAQSSEPIRVVEAQEPVKVDQDYLVTVQMTFTSISPRGAVRQAITHVSEHAEVLLYRVELVADASSLSQEESITIDAGLLDLDSVSDLD